MNFQHAASLPWAPASTPGLPPAPTPDAQSAALYPILLSLATEVARAIDHRTALEARLKNAETAVASVDARIGQARAGFVASLMVPSPASSALGVAPRETRSGGTVGAQGDNNGARMSHLGTDGDASRSSAVDVSADVARAAQFWLHRTQQHGGGDGGGSEQRARSNDNATRGRGGVQGGRGGRGAGRGGRSHQAARRGGYNNGGLRGKPGGNNGSHGVGQGNNNRRGGRGGVRGSNGYGAGRYFGQHVPAGYPRDSDDDDEDAGEMINSRAIDRVEGGGFVATRRQGSNMEADDGDDDEEADVEGEHPWSRSYFVRG
ncbi:hypothetical protein HK101_009714 [Irineochytrium annulatum]|nr:hypothetical protein HK101_009714 [Irineochytrium annulatum]